MRDDHAAKKQRGLEAARKRLWPNGDAPPPPPPPAPAPRDAGDDAEAPTLPHVQRDPGLRLRAPRNSSALAAATAVLIGAWLFSFVGAPRAREDADPGWSGPPLENLTVRGSIRIVDDRGNVVALFGSIPDESGEGETMALELRSRGSNGPSETLRLESLASGATLALRTPDRRSSVTLVSGEAGSYLLMADGSQQRVIGAETPDAVPAVATRPAAGERELDLLDGRAQQLGDGLSAVGLRVARGGLRGRILNTTSVRHTDVEIELALADQRLALKVPVISPGNSTGFAVALPRGLPEPLLRNARVARVTSTLRYDAHQPAAESAGTR